MRMIWNKTAKSVYALCALMAFFLLPVASQEKAGRTVVSLDGTWDIAEGSMAAIPEVFPYKVPVPGLVDMSSPDFFEVGIPSPRREAFWYHKTFQIEGPIPDVALLKVHKAKYGTKVFLNGQFVDEHQPCFTPGYFNLKEFLKGNGEPNQLVIRIGAHRESLPKTLPTGWDFEKYKYIPGIYDSVELILSGTPFIQNVQTAPLIQTGEMRIQAEVRTTQTGEEISLQYRIREAQSGSIVAQGQTSPAALSPNSIHTYDFTVAIPNARLWSPEDPFLYRLELETPADACSTRFAMRSFQFDATTRRALLNGKPYMLRGTNVCIYRFFEDAGRGNLPWNKDWVRDLHTLFKDMNWNSIRYCIGFPPEFWYDICDELGILIQDEFPIWFLSEWPEELKADAIAKEYEEWMRERWNHPCVVIWDAQNESNSEETGKALMKVRHLDLSNRPWDNGWATPQRETDTIEVHPYFFISDTFNDKPFKMETLADHSGIPGVSAVQKDLQNPMILNEYAWLWLNRDGSETSLTRKVYHNLLGPNSTAEQRREIYARYLAAQTEFWRSHRHCAGVLHFCGLGYSRPGGIDRPVAGATSDHFIDLNHLVLEPYFARYVKDAFAPVGVMLDVWKENYTAGETLNAPVAVINDEDHDWQGAIRLRLQSEGRIVFESAQAGQVPSLGRRVFSYSFPLPTDPGQYTLTAEIDRGEGQPVRSLSILTIGTE